MAVCRWKPAYWYPLYSIVRTKVRTASGGVLLVVEASPLEEADDMVAIAEAAAAMAVALSISFSDAMMSAMRERDRSYDG